MRRSPWFVLGVAVVFGASGAAARAQQAPCFTPASPVVGSPIVQGTIAGAGSSFAAPQPVLPYSYYVTFPEPARIYVGYGANDGFPFLGQPYGHAGDRWSWSAMSTGNSSLAKYYYQLLP
jgi:hypothetical protein